MARKAGLTELNKGLLPGGKGGGATVPALSGANTAAGGYYSPRNFGADRGSYEARTAAARSAMEEQQKALMEAQRALEESWSRAEEQYNRYESLKDKFRGETAEQYRQQLMGQWTAAVQEYKTAQGAYDSAWQAYKPYEDAYNRSVDEYNSYIRGEQEAYAGWKATIRGADEIREEQKGIKEKRAELQRRMQMANDIASGTAAPGIMAQAAQNEAAIQELQAYLGGAGDRERLLKEELDYSEYFRFEDLRENPDFAQKSKYVSSGAGTGLQVDPTTGQVYGSQVGDQQYEVVNRNAAALGEQAMGDINNEWSHLQSMTDDEIAMYNYLYATRGPQGAAEYLGYLRQELTARQMAGYNELVGQMVQERPVLGGAVATAGSLLLSPFAGLKTALGQVGYKLAGQEIDPNAGYALGTHTKNALRQSVSEKIEAHAGPVGSFAYNTVMSMGDMLMDATIGGPAAMGLIATRGFSESVIDAKERGLSDGQALSLGVVAGAAEVLTEKLGVDEHLHLPEKWKNAGFWKGLLHGAIGEGGEEGITNLVNLAADLAIAGEESNFQRSVREKMEQKIQPDGSIKTGMSREEATKEAVWETLKDFGLDVLGGAVSGGVFGGFNGHQGKRAEDARKKLEGEKAPSVAEGDSSPTQSAGEPEGDGAQAVPYEGEGGMTAPDNGTKAPDNGTKAPDNGTTVAGVAAQDDAGDVQKTGDGASLEELKEAAVMRRNPAVTKVMLTAQDEELIRRIEKATSKTEVTALDRGLGDEDIAMLLRLRELTGREIIVEEYNEDFYGYLHRASGEIHISAGSGSMMAQTFGHELTHAIEGTAGWDMLMGLVKERMQKEGKNWEDLRKAKIAFHESHGQTLTEAEADAEIVARYAEQHLLTDEKAIRQMVRDDRSMARRVLDWLDGLWAKMAKTKGAKEREFIRKAREHYRAALAESTEKNTRREAREEMHRAWAEGEEDAGDALFEELYGNAQNALLETNWDDFGMDSVPFSFAGEGAKNADREALERAKEMENRGHDRREIRRETGWFRGADQKWRFEIDDSKMKYHRGGDAQFRKDHPEYRRLRELELKFLEGTISGTELAELQELNDTWGREHKRLSERVDNGPVDLEKLIEHEELFEQYPHLRRVSVRFADLGTTDGRYRPAFHEITISEKWRDAPDEILLHEIQHAIQKYEGFAEGTNQSWWRDHPGEVLESYESERRILKRFYEWTGYTEYMQEQFKRMRRGEITAKERTELGERFLEQAGKLDMAKKLRRRVQELYEQTQALNKVTEGRTPFDLYQNTAGEIEARDTANRRGLDAEGRRERFPDTGDENTVFAEKGGRQYSLKGEENGPAEDDGVNGFTEGYYADDEAARAAHLEGYPVINGVQVVPMKTWVEASDRKVGANYGLVVGRGVKPGTLLVNFHNKHVIDDRTGKTLRADGVPIAQEHLKPVPPVFQRTEEDFDSLMEQTPEEYTHYSEEELEELEEMSRRAYMETDEERRLKNWEPVDPEDVTGRAKEFLDGATKQLGRRVAELMYVPRWAKRDFLDPIVRGIINTYLEKGTVDQAFRDELFETAWAEGRVEEREFYDTYKDVKDYLRTTPMHVPQEIRKGIGDFDSYSKQIFGKLRTKKDGGVDIGTVWSGAQEMAPALFPDDILNPEDQVRHMLEVARSIVRAEQNLNEFYAQDLADAKKWSRNDFEAAVQEAIHTAWTVRRVALEQKAEATAVADEEGEALTEEQVAALYPKLKEVRKALEKVLAKNLLSKRDKDQVQRLLRHDIQPEHLDPETDNVRAIRAVYEAKKAFEEVAEPIRKWNRQRKARLLTEAEALVDAAYRAGRVKDKSKGFLYARETMERNIRDIVQDEASAEQIVRTYIKPVHEAEAESIRMKNAYRQRVQALEISRKVKKGDAVSEAYAVQFYGEVSDILRMMEKSKLRLKKRDGKSYKEWQAELKKLWEENPGLDKDKIAHAAQEMGRIYEELFDQMNKARVHNGYEPVNHRSGYFPHFQQDGRDGILSQFGKAMGIDVEVQQLPTTINGMTHTFKPGIRWFGNALERKGFDTAYDAVEGFDRYIEGVASVVHQTENIQRLRALANQIRYRTGDEGLREQIRKIQERTDLTDEQKDALIRDVTKDGKFELSNFVVELDEYTNLLANKKSRADRNMEQAMGRDMYNVIKALEGRVAANMVAINPGSWLTNFIPITQGWACLDTRTMLMGMRDTVLAVKNDDGIVDASDFLTGRQGSDPLVKTAAQEWSGKLSQPMEWIDNFTAGTLVRARMEQNMIQGMSRTEALAEADEWAAGVMAARTKGAMPTVFHRSNPITKLFTQFQLEVNNQLSYIFKDIPREKRDEGKKALALALLKFALGAWLYNELYEKFLGRRPALDPIDMAFGFAKDWADPELDFADAAMGLGEKIAENTPFIGGLLGGGRVPISSALPDAENLLKAVGNKEWSAKKRLATAAKELAKPAVYLLPPFGGGQIKKIWEGLKMIRQGGSYTVDADGNPMLQYTLYSTDNAVQKALEAGQAMIFGKTTIRSGREWVEGGFGSLSAKQTATYQALIAMDVEQADAFDLLTALRSAETEGKKPRTAVQRDILRASGLEGDALATVYYDLMVVDRSKEKALMESLQKSGADMGRVANCLMDMKDADLLDGAAGSNAMRDALRASGLTDGQKQEIYHIRISDRRDDDIEAFRKAGMDMDDFLEVQNQYTTIKESYEDEGDMATAFARWVNGRSYTKEQKAVARECFKYWNMIPANADRYDKAMEAGLSDEDAFELTEKLNELEPPEGKTSVQQIQKWRVGIDNAWGPENQLQQLKAVGMDEKTYAKCEALWGAGVAPAAYVRAQEIKDQFDSDGNGSLTNEDWRNLINSLVPSGIALPGDNERFNMTNEQMGFLWQMLTGSKSTKNNPFSAAGGEKWLAIKNADK